jgi:hypothetical protein
MNILNINYNDIKFKYYKHHPELGDVYNIAVLNIELPNGKITGNRKFRLGTQWRTLFCEVTKDNKLNIGAHLSFNYISFVQLEDKVNDFLKTIEDNEVNILNKIFIRKNIYTFGEIYGEENK